MFDFFFLFVWIFFCFVFVFVSFSSHSSRSQSLTDREHVVDFQEHTDGLRGEHDGADADEERLDDVLVVHVGDASLPDVDASVLFTGGVPVPELRDDGDGVQPGVLGQGGRDDLQALRKGAKAKRLHASLRLGQLKEVPGHLDLGSAATRDQEPSYKRRSVLERVVKVLF